MAATTPQTALNNLFTVAGTTIANIASASPAVTTTLTSAQAANGNNMTIDELCQTLHAFINYFQTSTFHAALATGVIANKT